MIAWVSIDLYPNPRSKTTQTFAGNDTNTTSTAVLYPTGHLSFCQSTLATAGYQRPIITIGIVLQHKCTTWESRESKLYCSIDQAQATLLQPIINTGPKPGIDKAAGSNASSWYASTHTSKSCTNNTVKPSTVAPLQFQTVAVRFALFANLALPTKLRLCYWKLLAA